MSRHPDPIRRDDEESGPMRLAACAVLCAFIAVGAILVAAWIVGAK